MADREQIRKQMQDGGVEFILAQFVDIHGSAKVKMVPASCLDAMLDDGAGFAGAAVWGLGQGPHSHDMMARIDPDSYTPLPWMPNTARFVADLFVDGQSYPFCPRTNLKRVLQSVRDQGYIFNVGMEPEHFLVTRNEDGSIAPWNPDGVDGLAKPCYDFRSMAPAMGYLQELTSSLNQLGWGVYQTDHEDANGQYEINFDYQDALTTADRVTFFKMATSQIAKKYGAIATHMPKPFGDRTGSGLHIHFHLADAESGRCLFDDPADAHAPRVTSEHVSDDSASKDSFSDQVNQASPARGLGCSEFAYHFVGGILHHARALCAVTSPTVNYYKRLQLGAGLHSSRSGFTWTPAFISYGDNNRTQMIRTAGPGHFEDRTVSAGCNPYLALAAYVAAGMDGIKNKIDPGEPNLGNLYERPLREIMEQGTEILPQSLWEAVGELRNDDVIKRALGVIADEFIELKTREWETYDRQVTPWEIDEYLTFF